MKKSSLVKILGITVLAVTLTAAVTKMDSVNTAIAKALAPIVQGGANMSFSFSKLDLDAAAVNDVAASFDYERKGAEQHVQLKLKGEYSNPPANPDPRAGFGVTFNADLRKFVGDDEFDEIAKEADKFVLQMAQEQATDYGMAVTVNAQIVDRVVDANGKVQKLAMHMDATLDLNNLPAGTTKDEEFWKSVSVDAVISGTGIEATIQIQLNADYKDFAADTEALKQILEKVVTEDADTMDQITQFGMIVDMFMMKVTDPQTAPSPMSQLVQKLSVAIRKGM